MNNTRIGIAITDKNEDYFFGVLDIDNVKGDVFYRPSHIEINDSSGDTFLFDHISFHADGSIHIKKKNGSRKQIVASTDAVPISNVGQKTLFTDIVKDYHIFPQGVLKNYLHPVVYTIDSSELGDIRVFFRLDIISGKNLLAGEYSKTSQKDNSGEIFGMQFIPIGGNYPDKTLLAFWGKYTGDQLDTTNRYLHISTQKPRLISNNF